MPRDERGLSVRSMLDFEEADGPVSRSPLRAGIMPQKGSIR
jgi:hypothetical protein